MSTPGDPPLLPQDALVLEIGSGSRPWPRADVLVDRFLDDPDGQRGGGPLHRDRRPLVIAAGERLPFKDKVFDYVYSAHVVEHAEDLVRMLGEMSRVAKAGFIECPNPLLERLLDMPQHRWYIAQVDGALLAAPKTPGNTLTRREDRFYFHLLSDHYLVRRHWSRFVTRLHWQGSIECRMTDDPGRVMTAQAIDPDIAGVIERTRGTTLAASWTDACAARWRGRLSRQPAARGLWHLARQLKRRIAARSTPRLQGAALDRLLCCPSCRGDLGRQPAGYRCAGCARWFPDCSGASVLLD